MSALPPKADIDERDRHVRFSNRPVGAKRFQTVHDAGSMLLAGSRFYTESARGPFHHGIRRRGGTIFVATPPSACSVDDQIEVDRLQTRQLGRLLA
jgi:hypothetical protein